MLKDAMDARHSQDLGQGLELTRRRTVVAVSFGLVGATILSGCAAQPPVKDARAQAAVALAQLEAQSGGRLGVCILDTGTGQTVSHRGDTRFGMASSFKLALAAIILREGDAGALSLDTQIPVGKADLVSHAPVVTAHLDKGVMTIAALAEAAQTTSDNAAANILLRLLGGPKGFNARLAALGDQVTRLDRMEPDMNGVATSDPRDTTTPNAMAATIAKFFSNDVLSVDARDTLIAWMVATQTGQKRLRAGLPQGWKAGDKTGTAMPDSPSQPDRYNDIAIAWPKPEAAPIIITAYYESPAKSPNMRPVDEAVLAQVGRIVGQMFNS
ncbi:MAG: hypothetical protein RLZZ157_1448 [Pseudomonadota bacterium]|jgi:beta-lactamase class A